MSLSINSRSITAVKIGEEWINVEPDTNTFDTDAYEIRDDEHPGGWYPMGREGFVTHTGFAFKGSDGGWYYGPITAITCIRTK